MTHSPADIAKLEDEAKVTVRLPVSQLLVGDEYWGDIPIDNLRGTSMFWRVKRVEQDRNRMVAEVTHADGSTALRGWHVSDTIAVRRAL